MKKRLIKIRMDVIRHVRDARRQNDGQNFILHCPEYYTILVWKTRVQKVQKVKDTELTSGKAAQYSLVPCMASAVKQKLLTHAQKRCSADGDFGARPGTDWVLHRKQRGVTAVRLSWKYLIFMKITKGFVFPNVLASW